MKILRESKARSTGTTVQLVDRGLDDYEREVARDFNYEWNRWETICVDHGTVCSHFRKADAIAFVAHPEEWCEECM